MTPILEVEKLVKHFPGPGRGQTVRAVNGVSFALMPGETVAMVGESGCGKSTIGRVALRLDRPSAGRIRFAGEDITALGQRALRRLRPHMQMVFQDPWGTINPRMTVGRIIGEPLLLHTKMSRREREQGVTAIADKVRLDAALLRRHPAQLSGGQLQRVAIARAIVTRPRLVIFDEPTSSLDLSVRAEVLNLLALLRRETGAAFLFITHDLGTVRLIADRVIVLYLGSVLESGPAAEIFGAPLHPYTQALFSAQLPADPARTPKRHVLEGEVPSPLHLPPGCPFETRCPVAVDRCRTQVPALEAAGPSRRAACLRIADGGHIIPT